MSDSPPGIETLIGPILIGLFLNAILYGVFLLQAFIYYQTYRRDASWIRYFILYLFVIETLNTGFVFGMVYEPLILKNGTPSATSVMPKMLKTEPIVTVLIATPVQCFIAWRVKVLSKSVILSAIIVLLSIVAFGGGIWTFTTSILRPHFATLQESDPAVITWLSASAATDIIITLSLSYTLLKSRTGIKATDDQVSRIIRFTVHTGAITTLSTVMIMIAFSSLTVPTVVFAWDFCVPKLYSNALLSTLNARAGWDNLNGQHHVHNVLFGDSLSNSITSTRINTENTKGPQITSAKRDNAGIYELSTFQCEPTTSVTDVEQTGDEIKIHVTHTVGTSRDALPSGNHSVENV